MSYDIYLFQPVPGEDPVETARARLEVDTDEINPGPPQADAEKRKQQLVRALMAENPALEPFSFGYAEIASHEGISEDEARIRYRHVELNGSEKGNGIQITLYDDYASITVPYWHQPVAAGGAFDEIWRYLRVLSESGGFFVYDPQLERVLDLEDDRPEAVETYGSVITRIPEIVERSGAQPKRPWWKFW